MTEIRCQRCNGLLLMAAGSIDTEIKCRTCKYLNKIKMVDVASEINKSFENNIMDRYQDTLLASR